MDESVLLPILRTIPPGVAVDAACGTGRYAAHLVALRHQVRGFDRAVTSWSPMSAATSWGPA
jgi:diaminopimelate epimerase